MNAVRVLCPAKVNLTLEILGQRDDGYHELRTVFHAVSLCDELAIEPADHDSFAVTGMAGVPTDESNLCLKALRLFRTQFNRTVPVAMTLHKRIPVQAGLGGGSSDAAGVLAGMAALAASSAGGSPAPPGEAAQAQSMGTPQLCELAARLGSDVPFFLHGGAMLGSERGEVLEALPALAGGALVIAKPAVAMSTAEAYGLIRPEHYTDGSRSQRLAEGLRSGCALPEMAPDMYNVFTAPVERYRPEIAALRHRLLELNAQAVLLCGSGAAVCGWCACDVAARHIATVLGAEGFWAVPAQFVAQGVQVNTS